MNQEIIALANAMKKDSNLEALKKLITAINKRLPNPITEIGNSAERRFNQLKTLADLKNPQAFLQDFQNKYSEHAKTYSSFFSNLTPKQQIVPQERKPTNPAAAMTATPNIEMITDALMQQALTTRHATHPFQQLQQHAAQTMQEYAPVVQAAQKFWGGTPAELASTLNTAHQQAQDTQRYLQTARASHQHYQAQTKRTLTAHEKANLKLGSVSLTLILLAISAKLLKETGLFVLDGMQTVIGGVSTPVNALLGDNMIAQLTTAALIFLAIKKLSQTTEPLVTSVYQHTQAAASVFATKAEANNEINTTHTQSPETKSP